MINIFDLEQVVLLLSTKNPKTINKFPKHGQFYISKLIYKMVCFEMCTVVITYTDTERHTRSHTHFQNYNKFMNFGDIPNICGIIKSETVLELCLVYTISCLSSHFFKQIMESLDTSNWQITITATIQFWRQKAWA